MARKLIDQAEAARILGITPEQVGSLRDRKKLFPYRDGDQWKFKQEDIERLKAEMEAEKSEGGDEWEGDSELSDVELQLNDDLDSVLLSEIELGNSAKEGMSTIIGKMTDEGADADLPPAAGGKASKPASTGDSGITLAGDSGVELSGGDSGITLGEPSDLKLGGGSTIPLGGAADSDVKLVSGSDLGQKPGSSDKLFGSDALRLSDDELSLVDTGTGSSVAQTKTGDSSKKTAGSSIKLGDEELEVVLGGSDVTQSPTDSGIQLISASDSGLSLDQPLALGSSARRLLDVEDVTEAASPEDITEIKADDDFLLTAMDDVTEESSDSGSQVIALDSRRRNQLRHVCTAGWRRWPLGRRAGRSGALDFRFERRGGCSDAGPAARHDCHDGTGGSAVFDDERHFPHRLCAALDVLRHAHVRSDAQHVELGWTVRRKQFDHGWPGKHGGVV